MDVCVCVYAWTCGLQLNWKEAEKEGELGFWKQRKDPCEVHH